MIKRLSQVVDLELDIRDLIGAAREALKKTIIDCSACCMDDEDDVERFENKFEENLDFVVYGRS